MISSMKSNLSNTVSIHTPLDQLYSGKTIPKYIGLLKDGGIHSIQDLLWTIPLKIQRIPTATPFSRSTEGNLFRGIGKVISFQSYPAHGRKGKNRAQLHNISIMVSDHLDHQPHSPLKLQWFNAYGSTINKIKSLDLIQFTGSVQMYRGQAQIVSPQIIDYADIKSSVEDSQESNELIIRYPMVGGSSSAGKAIDKLPQSFWEEIRETLPQIILDKQNLLSIQQTFRYIHGLDKENWNQEKYGEAIRRLIYEEFFTDQIKVLARRMAAKRVESSLLHIDDKNLQSIIASFAYELTNDQIKVITEIRDDFSSGQPMMRLIQGDVGCGKTTVAIVAAIIAIKNGKQVALMCPTESLAQQHYKTISNFINNPDFKEKINLNITTGSHSQKEKEQFLHQLKNGEIDLAVGTHALFQKSVKFKKLGFAIIDEQHKFGVEQRHKLTSKGQGTHSLILTATPIPRSLSLTQYGDLDISTIKSIPAGRKGIKTRIVTSSTYKKFLSFIKTRLSLKEQIYIVVPAIEPNETESDEEATKVNFQNVQDVYKRFSTFFPDNSIAMLHGRLHADDKSKIFSDFTNERIEILISTTVVEVGIDVANATVMAIINPERFGLSSLHQLRGRVGRATKPGFCFLVLDKQVGKDSLERLQTLESTTDGFKIAEADLQHRGEGDLFGTNQSGVAGKRIANIIIHQDILFQCIEDVKELQEKNDSIFLNTLEQLKEDHLVTNTI